MSARRTLRGGHVCETHATWRAIFCGACLLCASSPTVHDVEEAVERGHDDMWRRRRLRQSRHRYARRALRPSVPHAALSVPVLSCFGCSIGGRE
eukprot:5293919-Pleurochrysis_carterae.AAC.3